MVRNRRIISIVTLVWLCSCGVSGPAHRAALDRNDALFTRVQTLREEGARLDRALERTGARAGARAARATMTAATLETRLAEHRKRSAAQAGRLAGLRRFAEGVRAALGAEGVDVRVRHGRMLVDIPEAVLFESGRAELKAGAAPALDHLARLVRGSDATFRVTGHTDDRPIQTAEHPSNWELGAARAIEVVEALIARGVNPLRLAAASRAAHEPVADNRTEEGRARNRRVELILEPDLSELPELRTALQGAGEGRP